MRGRTREERVTPQLGRYSAGGDSVKVKEITVRKLELPLLKPYKVSYRSYTFFDPFVIAVRDGDGCTGWGEGLVSEGSSEETQAGALQFITEHASKIVGMQTDVAKKCVIANVSKSPIAATALITAIEMLEGSEILNVVEEHAVPLLAMVVTHDRHKIRDEVDEHIGLGFKALKIKVGFDYNEDLERIELIRKAAAGRASLTLDANRAFDRETGCRFAAALDPEGIDQLEQPCAADDWESNAAVAKVSRVPLMLDESVLTLGDIERAATVPGVKFVKLKLRKTGSLESLLAGIRRIHELGMQAVLGDGTSTEIHCWMEACVARFGIDTPGQMNGFLKTTERLFLEPLQFASGEIRVQKNFHPSIDQEVLAKRTTFVERFR